MERMGSLYCTCTTDSFSFRIKIIWYGLSFFSLSPTFVMGLYTLALYLNEMMILVIYANYSFQLHALFLSK